MSAVAELVTDPVADDYVDDERPEVQGRWAIENLDAADWALRRLADLQREKAENEAIARRRIEEIQMRLATLNKRAERGIAYFEAKLTEWAKANRAELIPGKKKTRDLPSGSISFRKKGGGLVVVDEAALLKWAEEQGLEKGLVRIKVEPALSEIKKQLGEGEVPPGMDVEPEREEVVVKTVKRGED